MYFSKAHARLFKKAIAPWATRGKVGLKRHFESTRKGLSNGMFTLEIVKGQGRKPCSLYIFSIEKLGRETCHMIT